MWPTSNKQIHQKLMDQYDEKLPEMFADGSSVSNEEKAVLHMDLNYNLRIGFRKTRYFRGLAISSTGRETQDGHFDCPLSTGNFSNTIEIL